MLTLACTFAPEASELAVMRAVLRPYLESLGLSPDGCEELLLVATELAANAMEADGADEIRLRIEKIPGAVALELEDGGPGFRWSDDAEVPAAEEDRGRGLWLVRALTNDVTVERRDERTVVRAVRRFGSRPHGAPAGVSSTRGALEGP